MKKLTKEHAANLGLIVLALGNHEVGDCGDCSINDPIVSIIDHELPAHELLQALESMRAETAADIASIARMNLKDWNVTIA